jgi:peroxiredoxin
MALTESTIVPLGSEAPAFSLPDTSGKVWRLEDFAGAKALLVVFMCNHCPFVKLLKPALADFGREMQAGGAAMVAISSNDAATHPADAPERMAEDAATFGYGFPYLYDETQEVAKTYGAVCTPDFFLFGPDMKLAYRGQFDESRPGNDTPVTGADLRAALLSVLKGEAPSGDQKPSIGCSIKWKAA